MIVCWLCLLSPVILWWPRPSPGAEEPHSHLCWHATGWFWAVLHEVCRATEMNTFCFLYVWYLLMCAQGYGFPVNRLFDLLFEVRDQYNETLLKKWALVFRWALLVCHWFSAHHFTSETPTWNQAGVCCEKSCGVSSEVSVSGGGI